MRFDEKRVLVTGASRGIGRAIAQRFIEEGAKVLLAELNTEAGEAAARAGAGAGNRIWPQVTEVRGASVRRRSARPWS